MTRIVALTGAGISVASGLPTYTDDSRDKFSDLQTTEEMLQLYWNDLAQWLPAAPNAAHLALAEHDIRVITQNIDNLHWKAGTAQLIELHGNLREFYCPLCGHLQALAPAPGEFAICPTDGARLRPNIVFYGENVRHFDRALEWVAGADHLLVIGTSLTVFPAASLVSLARDKRIPVTVINQAAATEVPQELQRLAQPADDASGQQLTTLPAWRRYLQLFFRLQLAQWENYAQQGRHDLCQVDADIYSALLAADTPEDCSKREAAVWSSIRRRGLVDKHPAVARLRNRLDDWDNYLSPLPLPELPELERRNILATRMQADVLELLRLRTQLAKQQGELYPDLVMQSEDLDLAWVEQSVAAYLEQNLDSARRLIAAHKISWDSWFSDLARLGALPLATDTQKLVTELLGELGLDDALPLIALQIKANGLAGYVGVIQPGEDVRVLTRPAHSLSALLTLCHELGHACCHALNQSDGLYQTWTSSYDEAMAMLFERIGMRISLSESDRERASQLTLLENVRCAISFLFELDIWRQPDRAEELYLAHYGKLGLDLGDPSLWVLDSFRSIDPVYVHNYVLGSILAEQVLTQLRKVHGNDYLLWGQELRTLYADGRRRPLLVKLMDMGALPSAAAAPTGGRRTDATDTQGIGHDASCPE